MHDIIPPNNRPPSEEGLKMISHCPVCHYSNTAIEAKIIEENDNAHLIYIKCRRCQSAVLALFSASGFGLSSIGIITDFDSQEIATFKELSKVDSDDVLLVYQHLLKDEQLIETMSF